MSSDYNNPKSYQAGLGVEREINRSLTVGADFSYVKGVHLQRNRDYNVPLPRIRPDDPAQRPFFGLRSGTPRPQPALGQVQVRESTGKSLYRALTLRTKFQRSWGQFNAFYTLSRNLSDDDNERDAGGVLYDNPFDLSSEYGLSNLDRKHQFTASPVIFLPGAIDISSAIRFRSGRPIDASAGLGDANEDRSSGPDRPFLGPGVPFERNSFRNRALYDWDLRVQKRFNLPGETARLIISVEIFNVLNLDNIEFSRQPGDELLRGDDRSGLRIRWADKPELLTVEGPQPDIREVRQPAVEQHRRVAVPDAVRRALPVLKRPFR